MSKCKCCGCETNDEKYCSPQCEVSDLEFKLSKPSLKANNEE
jgi:hypothetical protein